MAVTIASKASGTYGYVEPNFLSAPRTGQVRGDLPAAASINELTNGQFVKRDTVNGEVNFSGEGKWWMVFNEEKLYDERYQAHKYFAQKKNDYVDGVMVPRIFVPVLGDTFTTDNLKAGSYAKGSYVAPGATGILEASSTAKWLQVVEETTMPDGITPAVKLEVVANQ